MVSFDWLVKMKKYTYIGDAVIIVLVLSLGFSPYWFRAKNATIDKFIIEMNGETFAVIDCDADATIVVPAQLGPIIVEIHDDSAWVKSSSCPLKYCVEMGAISKPHQIIACVPNKVLIKATGNVKKSKLDAILD